ncbi:MAG: JAB domain-containing protein [Nitrospira sp.]|nr:JAB domain-containing protein [Nitrospira sp.]
MKLMCAATLDDVSPRPAIDHVSGVAPADVTRPGMTARRPPPIGRGMRLAFRPAGNARLLLSFFLRGGFAPELSATEPNHLQKDRKMQHQNTYIPRFRISLVRETRGTYTEQKLSSSADADRLLRPMLQDLDREHFIVIGLDAKNAVIGMNTVSIGSLTLAIVYPREVCKPLILMNAAGFICRVRMRSFDRILP